MNAVEFRAMLAGRGRELWRDMPWRADTRPYYVLVSELMLQQTQVSRVVPKFLAFVEAFPDEEHLAEAKLSEVIKHWQGLGYNRRAKYLHDSAKMIVHDFGGIFPENEASILKLPGVGRNTAGAIRAYAFDRPSIFVETNIRTVYIHHFFADDFAIDDHRIKEKLEETLDRRNPRRFYQSLMDYGAWLKNQGVKTNARSKHYKKQSALAGSLREMRGEILRRLSRGEALRSQDIVTDPRFDAALAGLVRDHLVSVDGNQIRLVE